MFVCYKVFHHISLQIHITNISLDILKWLGDFGITLCVCQSVHSNSVAIILAPNIWFDFKFGLWQIALQYKLPVSWDLAIFHHGLIETILITKTSTPNGRIDFIFDLWLYMDREYFVNNFGWGSISNSMGYLWHNSPCNFMPLQ